MRREGLVTRRPGHRGSGFDPGWLPGLVLWTDAALRVGLAAGDVSTWDDLSTAANHGSQASEPVRPLYEVSGWNGTYPSVLFSAGDFLSFDTVAAGFSGTDKPFTLTATVQRTGAETGELYIFGLALAASAVPVIRVGQTNLNQRLVARRDNDVVESSASSGSNLVTTRHQVTAHFNGSVLAHYVDGVRIATDATDLGAQTFDQFRYGIWRTSGGYAWRSAGFTLYNRALTGAELDNLWGYNRSHFGGLT